MEMKYQGGQGKTYILIEPAIGKGGEGSIYKVSGMPGHVAKIFVDSKRTETRKHKILAMISTPIAHEAMSQVTWPVDILYDNNQFIGYIMPAISNNEELNVMYSDKYRCTFLERIIMARNLCAAVNAVHNAGQICGDLNPKNIVVNPNTARVTLVDTDSYHISDKKENKIFRCEVGLPEYLPNEIQEKMKSGYRLDNAPLPTFTKQSDYFALAVHIFALLMNGCHPFACRKDNVVNIGSLANSQPSVPKPEPIENICSGFFPFYTKKSGISIPLYAPDFDILPLQIQNLFVRAFVEGYKDPLKRPNPVEWYKGLSELEKNLTKCPRNSRHLYPSHINYCPWCNIETKMNHFSQPVNNVLKQTSVNINTNNVNKTNSISAYTSVSKQKNNRSRTMGVVIGAIISLIIIFNIMKSVVGLVNDNNKYNNSEVTESNNVDLANSNTINDNYTDDSDEPIYKTINIDEIVGNAIKVEPIEYSSISADKAEIVSYSGSITEEDQVDVYYFTPQNDGRYRIDISNLHNDVNVNIYVKDENEEVIEYNSYCSNGDGVTVYDLKTGTTYEVDIKQNNGLSDYNMSIGMQKPIIDISSYTNVKDSVEFIDQRNIYSFTVPIDGRYRFELSSLHVDTKVDLYMFNDLGETIESYTYCSNGDGITVYDLKAGETYELQVRQNNEFGEYELNIGFQKNSIDISEASLVYDSIEYTDQRNIYSFTVPVDGRYRFEVSGLMSDTKVDLYMFNNLGETVESYTYCSNGDGITVYGLEAGDIYEIQVRYNTGVGDYELLVGKQKEVVNIERNCIINDSIEYTDQRNVYSFTADYSGDLSISLNNMNSDMNVELCVFNDLGEEVTSDSSCSNGEGLKLSNVSSGTHYEIQVRQNYNFGSYSLCVE